MKLQLDAHQGNRRNETTRQRSAAFTIPEVMVTMTIMIMVLGTLVTCHLLGLRMFEMTKAKLGASDDARRAITALVTEIRSAKFVRVGKGDFADFKPVGVDTPHIGNAIQVYATTNTNSWVRYYWDASDQKVKRAPKDALSPTVIASAVSNQMVFSAEDYLGQPLKNNAKDYVIGLNLQFYQLQYPFVEIGPGKHYTYYQLQTRITPRAP